MVLNSDCHLRRRLCCDYGKRWQYTSNYLRIIFVVGACSNHSIVMTRGIIKIGRSE